MFETLGNLRYIFSGGNYIYIKILFTIFLKSTLKWKKKKKTRRKLASCRSIFFFFSFLKYAFFYKELWCRGKQVRNHESCLPCKTCQKIYQEYPVILWCSKHICSYSYMPFGISCWQKSVRFCKVLGEIWWNSVRFLWKSLSSLHK